MRAPYMSDYKLQGTAYDKRYINVGSPRDLISQKKCIEAPEEEAGLAVYCMAPYVAYNVTAILGKQAFCESQSQTARNHCCRFAAE